MFRESITHSGGTTEGTASEQHALTLLARALRRGYAIDLTRDGGATISWTAGSFGPGETVVTAPRSIVFTPELPVGRALTESTCDDLLLVQSRDAEYDPVNRVITGGIWRIPQGATARLRARGLVVVDDRNRVRPSLTAQIGLFARDHCTRTTDPGGWYYPAGGGARRYSAASVAICSCGFARHCGDRTEARRHITGHRTEVCTEFVRDLTTPAPATA
ncbi:hypothetical protein E0L36_22100 [Streptomyces sp. AJS327]|uniref:hypothetical protein n=1 Tax=Streptomyces sp. AJS327 TaxID=2545265 RepID=UPI0015DDEE47|nr:hypothetical protein [Streptomyces sp. AJS327]MBA0053470.1 hypothetical protein [Streptomyces sp. AJS327]